MADNKHTVYLALGANIGNKEENIRIAIENINERIGKVEAVSAFYMTEPHGFDSDNIFVNAACKIITILTPPEVLEYTQVIERELGRSSKSVNNCYADRPIDIDILMYDDLVVEYPHLVIPHPHLHERDYVLIPFAEIASDVMHPYLNRTIGELEFKLTSCKIREQ